MQKYFISSLSLILILGNVASFLSERKGKCYEMKDLICLWNIWIFGMFVQVLKVKTMKMGRHLGASTVFIWEWDNILMKKCQIAMSHLVFIISLCSILIMYFIFRLRELLICKLLS